MYARRSIEGLSVNEEVCTNACILGCHVWKNVELCWILTYFSLGVNLESGSISTKSSPASAQSKYGL